MGKYLKKTVTDETTDNQAEAFIALSLDVNLLTGEAIITEGGWKTAQGLADGKNQAVNPILWVEPNIHALNIISNDYTTATPIFDVIFDAIGYRMATLDDIPDGSGPNPFKGCTFEDIPAPTP